MQSKLSTFFVLFALIGLALAGAVRHKDALKRLEDAKASGDAHAINEAEKEVKKQKDILIAGAATGWIPVLGAIGIGLMVGGEELDPENDQMNCWQQILHQSELSEAEVKQYRETGLPLPVLLQHTDYTITPHQMKDGNGNDGVRCIFRNKQGEQFILEPSYKKGEQIVAHATPYVAQRMIE